LSKVEHPAISYSLIKLGIVTDVELTGNKVKLVFEFPFPVFRTFPGHPCKSL